MSSESTEQAVTRREMLGTVGKAAVVTMVLPPLPADLLGTDGEVAFQEAALAAQAGPGNDTTPPSAVITAPVADTEVAGLLPVDVTVSDDFGVARVDLYADIFLVGSDTTPPFEFVWDTTTRGNGFANLSIRAYDAAGNEGRSTKVSVTVNNN